MARWWPVLGNTVSFALASSGNMSGRGCPSLKRSSRDYSTTGDYTSCNHIWLVVWNLFFSIQLGFSSFQLTNSIMFQRGRAQPPTRYVWTVIVECLDNSLYILLNWYIIQTLYNTHFYLLLTYYIRCVWVTRNGSVTRSWSRNPWRGTPFSASKILGRLPWGIQDGRKSPIKWAGVPYRMGLWLIVSQWIIPENSLRLAPLRHCRCKKNHVWWHRR